MIRFVVNNAIAQRGRTRLVVMQDNKRRDQVDIQVNRKCTDELPNLI